VSQSPATIGRFKVINRIGRGGMGSLYLAWDPVLERQIAIKLLREDMEELRERFDREARSVARLRHPNIVTIFDVGEQDGQPFIAMEYIHGQTLAEIIRSDYQPSVSRKLKIIDELCDGLAFAHKMAIIHRDVKPANIMVEDEGVVKILDFGIARIAESGMTMAGMLIGTLNYMAPEQIAGQVVDNRSDIFAIGCVMYELLAQRQAFPGGLHTGIINRILYEHPPGLETICPNLDGEVVEVVRHALEKDPQVRYQDLAAMRRDLQRARQRVDESDETIVVNPDKETVALERPPEKRSSQAGRRGTPPEALARLRATQLAAHLERAKQALDALEFEDAISSAEHALLLDPDSPTAAEIIDHARAALDEHSVQELVKRAGELIEAGSLTEALGLCEQALTIAPGSPAAVELRETLDRLRLERDRERQRLEAIRVATERARSALGRGDYEEALNAAEEVLRSAPGSETATNIRHEAEDGIARARQAALDRRAADTADEARRVFEAGDHDRALEILAAFEADHPHVAATLEALEGEKARLQREAERARRQRVDGAIVRANEAPSHEEAINHLREALAIDPGRADAADLLAQRQHALEVEREEARQALERERIIGEGLSRAAAEASHEEAIGILEALGSIGADREDVRAALGHRRAALERQLEEARRAEELGRRIEALLAEARQRPGHEAAIALLEEARGLDPGRRDVEDALRARQEALRQEREERRRAEERAARIAAAVQQADAAGSDEEALAILKPAFERDHDPHLKTRLDQRQAALARKQEEARRARETAARVAAAIATSSDAASHQAAIDVLVAALERDAGHAELTTRLAERRALLEQQKREEQERLERQKREEQERRERQKREEQERREREARERREQLAAALARARATASHAEAIAILEQAAALDPQHQELRAALSDRRAALEREREEARRERERQERIASAIRDANRASGSEAALAILQRALAEAPDHEELRALAATAEANLAREREEARKVRERQGRVAALLGEAKKTASHERAIEMLREILQLEPGHREGQGLLERRLAALEEERVEAKRQAGIADARRSIGEAIAAGDLDRADAVLKEAEQRFAAAKLLKTERGRVKEARAAAERAAAEKAAAAKAAAEKAAAEKAAAEKAAADKAAAEKAAAAKAAAEKAAAEKAAAEKAAAEKAAAEKAAAEKAAAEKAAAEKAAAERAAAQKAAAEKAAAEKAAREKAAAEKAAAEKAAAQKAAAEKAAAEKAAREKAAREKAAADRAAAEQAAAARAAADKAAREKTAAERAAVRPSEPGQPAEWIPSAGRAGLSPRALAITGSAAVLAVLLVVGYFVFRGGQDSSTGAPAQPPAAQGPAPNPTPSAPAPQNAPPATGSTEPRTTSGPASPSTAPVPETPPVVAPPESKVAGDLKAAQESLQRGQLQAAADAITRALRVEPRNQALRQLGRTISARARQAASNARTRATGQSDAATGSPPFRAAQIREQEAGRRERADQHDRAVRLYGEAASLYADAARTAPAARPETPVTPPETAKPAETTKPPAPTPAPAPPPAAPPSAPSSTPAGTGAGATTPPAPGGTGAAGATTTPPPVTPSPPPATAKPTPPPPAQPSIAVEEAAIRATLREYAAAYESLSVDAVRRVYPGVNAELLARSFNGLSAQQVRISGDDKITIDGANAVVTCTVLQSFTPKVGQGRRQNVKSTFRLQKTGGRWVIVERR
jgi:serine/threonine protein kinase